MDIKLHPDAKKLLDEINSRRRLHLAREGKLVNSGAGLKRGNAESRNLSGASDTRWLSRADLEGR